MPKDRRFRIRALILLVSLAGLLLLAVLVIKFPNKTLSPKVLDPISSIGSTQHIESSSPSELDEIIIEPSKESDLEQSIAESSNVVGLQESSQDIVKTFQVFEVKLRAASPSGNPYLEGPSVNANFKGVSGLATGEILTIKGFWDGGNTWRIRFSPILPGEWSYETYSSDPGLDGVKGTLIAISPTAGELSANPLLHGYIEPDGFAWKFSDGTLFLPVGDTQWSFSEENTTHEWERWMSARQTQGFNSFLGTVWLAKYTRPDATKHPFPNMDPTTEDLEVAYFQRLDHLVQYANDHGILMGLTIGGFPDNTKWFKRFGTRERNDRWFKYIIARYSAYNVRWMLYGEVNEANPPWGVTWQEEVKHSAQLVKDEDPYQHPIGSHHNSVDKSSADNLNMDYIVVQAKRTDKQYQLALQLREYGKPIWFEEYWYEPEVYDDDVELGIRNTHRNFIAAMAFPTMGSLMRAHYPDFNIDQVETDPGAQRMCYFQEFYAGLDLVNFTPASHLVNKGQSGQFGHNYAIFLQGGGSVNIDLSSNPSSFQVWSLDINTGIVKNIGAVTGGTVVTINSQTEKDVSILLLDKESISSMRNTSSGFALTSFRLTEDGYIDQELYGINSPIAFQLWYPGSVDCGY